MSETLGDLRCFKCGNRTTPGHLLCTDCRQSNRRGKCRYCGRTFGLTQAGLVRKHKMQNIRAWCGGGGQIPS